MILLVSKYIGITKSLKYVFWAVPILVVFNVVAMKNDAKQPLLGHKHNMPTQSKSIVPDDTTLLSLSQSGSVKDFKRWIFCVRKMVKDKNMSLSQWSIAEAFLKASLLRKSSHSGNTPLHCAVLRRSMDMIACILWCCAVVGVDVASLKNNDGKTPQDLLEDIIKSNTNKKLEEEYDGMKSVFDYAQKREIKELDNYVDSMFFYDSGGLRFNV
jgi:hypothetical protein